VKTVWKWISGVAAFIVAALFFFSKSKTKKKPSPKPPKNKVSEVMVEEINDDLTEELGVIKEATESDDPSKKLAILGNARSRR